MNVLIVSDDEEDSQVLFEAIGEMLPDTVCCMADTAIQCLKLVADLPAAPDFIFLDSRLPDMSSDECLEKLVTNPKLISTKFIMYAGLGGPELEKRFMERGADYFLEKPGSITQLRHALSQIFHISVPS
ncbi:response regulator [Fulvivirgaceae bacterium PWU4]|uniref:Response regulator n=1 Tax=Chryseosolibacter histidini TaxID=2782349 RepID=A0AAP2DLX7_9BACT|nr:response regulator [Chryseosolibacter histidini]MBT1697562.1 response regulator [Chryseosolibacter histidini]